MHPAEVGALRLGASVMGALPDHLGQFRVANRYWRWRRPPHRIMDQRMADGPRLQLDLGDRTQALAYMTRRYSSTLIADITTRLPRDGGVFVDIGANVGLVTFQVAWHRPRARIIAFEPGPDAIAGFLRNRPLNPRCQVTLEERAVGNTVGTASFVAGPGDLGAGALTDDDPGAITVPATTLDAYCEALGIERLDVVKIDVEGSENDVLDGAHGLLTRGAIRALVVELNDRHLERRGLARRDVIDRLAAHGFTASGSTDADDVAFDLRGERPRSG
jgi:FkbM family methyltransferase